jgi:hypothetical protein
MNIAPTFKRSSTVLMPFSPASRPRLKPVPAVRVPDSRHKIYPTKVIAQDHELEGRGGPGRFFL